MHSFSHLFRSYKQNGICSYQHLNPVIFMRMIMEFKTFSTVDILVVGAAVGRVVYEYRVTRNCATNTAWGQLSTGLLLHTRINKETNRSVCL